MSREQRLETQYWGIFYHMKFKIEGITGNWFMAIGPVMRCKTLSIQEKLLLSCIMSLKNSMDSVYVPDDRIMGMTGLSEEEYNQAYTSLRKKNLIAKDGREWGISRADVNRVIGADLYYTKKKQIREEVQCDE